MPKANCQKIKLLKLMELFNQETDELHPLKTSEICTRLNQINISCDRRTLGKDIECLNTHGFEVMSVISGHEKAYYIEDRKFNIPELKILIDAVQAASFITTKKTYELINKIANLGGSYRAEILKRNVICFNTRKHSNESIYYNVDSLEYAIQQKKIASFFYFDLNELGARVYRKNKERYMVEPLTLIYNEDNYYLMCYSSIENGIRNYRVDRMEGVDIEDLPISNKALMMDSKISSYTEQVFKMYGDNSTVVTIQFDNSLIGVIYDKFGESIKIKKVDESIFEVKAKIQISPTFWGWLFQFGGRMKIISPKVIVNQYREQVDLLLKGVSE